MLHATAAHSAASFLMSSLFIFCSFKNENERFHAGTHCPRCNDMDEAMLQEAEVQLHIMSSMETCI